jgi:hypothetical protein
MEIVPEHVSDIWKKCKFAHCSFFCFTVQIQLEHTLGTYKRKKNVYGVLVGKPKGKRLLENPCIDGKITGTCILQYNTVQCNTIGQAPQ